MRCYLGGLGEGGHGYLRVRIGCLLGEPLVLSIARFLAVKRAVQCHSSVLTNMRPTLSGRGHDPNIFIMP